MRTNITFSRIFKADSPLAFSSSRSFSIVKKTPEGISATWLGQIWNIKIGANSSLMPVEHAAVSHEFYQLPSTILLRFDAQKNASAMLAFAILFQETE